MTDPTGRVRDEHGVVHMFHDNTSAHILKCSWAYPVPKVFLRDVHALLPSDTAATCLFCCRVPVP